MLFPTSIVFKNRYNKRASGSYVHYIFGSSQETININVSTLTAILNEVPSATPAVPQVNRAIGGGGVMYTEVTGIPGSQEYTVDYATGVLTFNADVLLPPPTGSNGILYVDYYGTGSIVWCEDITNLQESCEHFRDYYFDRQGTYAMTGTMDLGANDITNAKSLSMTQSSNADALFINKTGTGTGRALYTSDAGTGDGLTVIKTGSAGKAVYINKTIASGPDNCLDILNASAGVGLYIYHTGNNSSAIIEHYGSDPAAIINQHINQDALRVVKTGTGSGDAIYASNVGTGHSLNILKSGATAGSAVLLTKAGAGSNACLDIANSSNGASVRITNTGTGTSLAISHSVGDNAVTIASSGGVGALAIQQTNTGSVNTLYIDDKGKGYGIYLRSDFTTALSANKVDMFISSSTTETTWGQTGLVIDINNAAAGGAFGQSMTLVSSGGSAGGTVTSVTAHEVAYGEYLSITSSSNDAYGIYMNITGSPTTNSYAFEFYGNESGITIAGTSTALGAASVGVFSIVGYIRINVGGSPYYMPYGTIA